jgi:hypothetical protein
MKRFGWILVLLMLVSPAWAANKADKSNKANNKITVQQLKDLLVSAQQAKKTDQQVADQIKGLELSEELTSAEKSKLLFASPGPLTSEQISVLEARSCMLAPPPSDLPDLPTPDAAAQKAILDKALEFAAKNDQQIHHLTALKVISHYGHVNDSSISNAFGAEGLTRDQGNVKIMNLTSRYTETVENDQGNEKITASTADPKLMRVSPLPENTMRPALSVFLHKAEEGGKINWLRWETISGAKIAVFSFDVDKKSAIYNVDYCCFPTNTSGGYSSKPFKKNVGLHGEFFIDPDTGNILRLLMQAQLSTSDFVDQEDVRIDFGTTTIDNSAYILPVSSVTYSELNVAGDHPQAAILRRTFLVAGYANYQLAGAAQK